MPPAFVLSQDQTLRKKIFLSEIPIQALIYEITLIVNFKVYIALFNFQSARPRFRGNESLIYHHSRFCQIEFEDFSKFFHQPRHSTDLKSSGTGRKTSSNIASLGNFASDFKPFFGLFCDFLRISGDFWAVFARVAGKNE